MASIADIEQLLEDLFERSTSRLFRTKLQAVQIEHRVERTMERAREGRGARTSVPARYRVRLHPDDLSDLAPDADAALALAGRLADAALTFARAHAYHLPGRPSVVLLSDPSLERGRVEIDVDPPSATTRPREGKPVAAREVAPPPQPARPPVQPNPGPPASTASAGVASPVGPAASAFSVAASPKPGTGSPGGVPAADAMRPAETGALTQPEMVDDVVDAGADDAFAGSPDSIRGDGTQTMVFRRPSPETPRAVLRVLAPDGGELAVEVDGRPLTLGRASDNALVLPDPRVSRHHGRLQARHGTLVYADLDSTNGSRVNGVRVDEIALGVGDRLLLGDTVLVVETLPS